MASEHFTLYLNAFWILKAGYESSRAEIVDLVEDAEFDEIYSQDLIQRSQQALLSPNSRLDQELGWLPGLSAMQLGEIRALLEAKRAAELYQAISFLPELPKANVLAHLCESIPVDVALAQSLLKCWEDIDRCDLLEFVNSNRQSSGFPKVDSTQQDASLVVLEVAHAKNLAAAIWRLDEPGATLERIVEAEVLISRPSSMLTRVVRQYDILSEPKLSQISDAINAQVKIARQINSDLHVVIDEIADLLRRWDDVNQPVQVFEQYQGHEEGRSKKIYETLRSLCLELANERGEFQHAKELSEALLDTFPELESVAEVLKSDVETLENLHEQKKQFEVVRPLVEACEAAKLQLAKLKLALRNVGFTHTKRGALEDIFDAFERAAKVPTTGDAAFVVVRDLALFINNDQNEPETAFRLIDGLISYRHAEPSHDLVNKLEEERAVLHRNWKMAELERQSGNLGAMLETIEEMLEYAKGNDRSELLQMKSGLERKQTAGKAKWLIYGGIAAVIGLVVIFDNLDEPTSRTSYQPTTTYQPSASRPTTTRPSSASFAESRPPAGQGRILDRSQVRYCVFQGERLEAIRLMTTTNDQIDKFNSMIDDFNSRCSDYQYRSGVLSSVRREASSRSAEFDADARRIVASW